ncbi:eukaryotic translation initiation factor 2-alpha kinase 3 [Ciona intestinalis]
MLGGVTGIAKFLTSVGLFSIVTAGSPNTENQSKEKLKAVTLSSYSDPLLIATTLDGKISALNIADGGKLKWVVDLGHGPLVSSSLAKLVYKEDGKYVRLIPSLHGGLFRFDGESVEAVPFDADQLLSSSFRLADETVLVGGKETSTSGIDAFSGRVLYTCTANGCDKQQNVHDASDLLIVKRQQQVVRSIINRNGHENWNFSVGEINLDFSQGTNLHLLEGSSEHSNEQSYQKQDTKQTHTESDEFSMTDARCIKVVVPDGMVCLVTRKNEHVVKWKHKLGSPVSAAWLLVDGELRKLDLFDPSMVPALDESTAVAKKAPQINTIYMGSYDNHVYIQASPAVQKSIAIITASNRYGRTNARQMSPKFAYRRCHGDMTPVAIETNKDDPTTELVVKGKPPQKANCVHGLTLYNEQFHNDGGYYLQDDSSYLSRIQSSKRMGRNTVDSSENDSYDKYNIDIVYSSFMHWWKELLILTVSVSIFVQCLINKCMQAFKSRSTNETTTSLYESPPDHPPPVIEVEREYESRFLTDFEPLECLGKGGFGIVFKARNKMDDCTYAVKRILLPNNVSSRDKVLREVRALAKLDHPAIVRYFNSWNEEPPAGWQQKRDAHLKDISAWSSTAFPNTSEKPISKRNKHSTSSGTGQQSTELSSSNHIQPDDDVIFGCGTTQGFVVDKTTEKTSDSGLFDDQQNDSWGDKDETWADEPVEMRSNIGGKFFQSDSSLPSVSGSIVRNRNNNSSPRASVPFGRYMMQDSLSVVFDDQVSNAENFRTNNQVNDKKPPSYESLFSNAAVRRRSSAKATDTSTSELKAVVCMQDASTGHQGRLGQHNDEDAHPHDNTIYLYIQMQLCKKESLREWLAANVEKRDFHYCLNVFQQVVSAVAYVHDSGLIHRDLKPSNVLFSLDGTIKVGDFGLVTHAGEGDPFFNVGELPEAILGKADDKHTQRVGTRMYMAPEQMSSSTYSEKIDIFALGLIFFELIHSFGTQMERILHLSDARKLKFPIQFLNNYPKESKLTHRMLSHKASDRPSANEVNEHEVFSGVLDLQSRSRHRTTSSRSSDSTSS